VGGISPRVGRQVMLEQISEVLHGICIDTHILCWRLERSLLMQNKCMYAFVSLQMVRNTAEPNRNCNQNKQGIQASSVAIGHTEQRYICAFGRLFCACLPRLLAHDVYCRAHSQRCGTCCQIGHKKRRCPMADCVSCDDLPRLHAERAFAKC